MQLREYYNSTKEEGIMKKLIQLLTLGASVFMITGCGKSKISEESIFKKVAAFESQTYSTAKVSAKLDFEGTGIYANAGHSYDAEENYSWDLRLDKWISEDENSRRGLSILNEWPWCWSVERPFGEGYSKETIKKTITYYSDLSVVVVEKGFEDITYSLSSGLEGRSYHKVDFYFYFKFNKYGFLTKFIKKGEVYHKEESNERVEPEEGYQKFDERVSISYHN